MRLGAKLMSVGLVMVLGGAVVLPYRALAQSAVEAGGRKIRVRVVPVYPPLARQMNVAGRVKIEAIVAADGHVVSTRVVGGSPLLANASVDAIKRFQFEPSPRETTEIIEFQFDR